MIQIIGQATQKNGGSPSWVLTGICKSAARTGTGTYTVTIDYLNTFGIDNKDKLAIFVSAERSGLGTERLIIDWTAENTFRIRNYTARNNQTLGDCMLTITIMADIPTMAFSLNGGTFILNKFKFYDVTNEGGYINAANTAGYPGETNSITGVTSSDAYKLSGFGITGSNLTGNDFKYYKSDVSAEALFEHSRELTLENGDHGVLSADKMSGFSGDVVTVDATTDEGWYFTGLNVTGATATGNQFMFVGENVTAEGLYTDEGYPITYLSDEHVQCTGDAIYIPGDTGITLETGYDPYYRISGYEITGGTIENGILIPTGPCTAKAIEKVNTFTATGNFEKGSNVSISKGTSNVPAKYALHQSHTGDIPSSWYATSNRWKPNDVSAYSITLNPIMKFTANCTHAGVRQGKAYVTGVSLIGSTQTQSQSYSKTNDGSVTWSYNKTLSTTSQNVNYGISAKLNSVFDEYYGYTGRSTAAYIATGTTGTWTATGIAP